MPFSSLVSASIETAINKLLPLDKGSAKALDNLSCKVIKLTLLEYKQPIFFYIANRRVEVLNQYEGEVDVALSLNIETLIALKNNQSISELIKNEQLVIEGDIKVLQQFADLLTGLEIDWGEILVPYTGDVLAHRISQQAKKVSTAATQHLSTSKAHLSDYLTHESKLAVSPLEFAHFSDQVKALAAQVEHLAHTLTQFERS